MNALVVVAHDDDVVLWMGGAVHHLRDWNWHLVSMCNQGNVKRKRYFEQTSSGLGARSDTLDFLEYQDRNSVPEPNSIDQMKQSLLQLVGTMTYDYVFTHSRDPNGEYSRHDNHHEVCKAIESLISENKLAESRDRLAHFCYSPIYGLSGLASVARKDANYFFQLTYKDLAFKVQLIRSHMASIASNLEQALGAPCPNPEAFEGEGLSLPCPFIGRP